MIDKEATNRETEKQRGLYISGPGDTLSNVIHLGNNFAVNAEEGNLEGAHLFSARSVNNMQHRIL